MDAYADERKLRISYESRASTKAFDIQVVEFKSTGNIKIKDFNIDEKLKSFTFSKLLLIHDENDKIIPFKNSESIVQKNPNKTELKKFKNIGHYKMLWNNDVVDSILMFLSK